MNAYVTKKKVLHKVRRNFLNKAPEDEEDNQVVQVPQAVNDFQVQIIDTSCGIVERNRKICVGVRFLNSHFNVSNIKVENRSSSTAVTFNLQPNENIPQIPWEYYVKRLESYGDLNLATWARKIKEHHVTYPKIMSQYSALAKSEDPLLLAKFRQIKAQVDQARKELEGTYPYKCVTLFSNGTAALPVKATYSEGFLKEMDHTLDGFVDWVSENGIPKLFRGESPIHQEIGKALLDCSVYQGDPVKYGPEYPCYIYDKNNVKKRAVIQLVFIVEPVPEGMFATGYAVLKRQDDSNPKEDLCLNPIKCAKEECVLENLDSEALRNESQEKKSDNDLEEGIM